MERKEVDHVEETVQTLELSGRKRLNVTAVREIVSFSDNAAEIDTALGRLQITGSGLHVEKADLESGVFLLTGRIDSLYYPEKEAPAPRKGILSRIWG